MWSKIFNQNSLASEMLEKEGLSEIYNLGILQDKKIVKTDKAIAYDLNVVLACIIRDYLKLYNNVNLGADCPTAYLKALYPDSEIEKDCITEGCTDEELNKWTDMVCEVASKFDALASGWQPTQKQVDQAFDMLKKIYLGLWT